MSRRPIDDVDVQLRIGVGDEETVAYLDVVLGDHTATLTRTAANELTGLLHDRLAGADRFDAAQAARKATPAT